MAKLNITQASKEFGIARSTLQRAIKAGKVTAATGENGYKYIDYAEMIRVFGESSSRLDTHRDSVGSVALRSDLEHKLEISEVKESFLRREVELLKKEVERLEKLTESQRDMLAIWHRRLTYKK